MIPKEHWSFIHNFKRAKWISNTDLALRIPIMLVFLAWVFQSVQRAYVITSLVQFIHGINFLLVPLHTLIICRSKMDRMYLMHLIGVSVVWLCLAIREMVEHPDKMHIFRGVQYILLSVTFLIWSVPTRILYFQIFLIARKTLGVNANFLFSRFILSLSGLFIFGILALLIHLAVHTYCKNFDHYFLLTQVETILFGLWTLFEIFMYSKIDPFKRVYKFGLNCIEKVYISAGIFMILQGLVMIGVIIYYKHIDRWVHIGEWILIRCILVARFILLWYYCVNELKSYMQEPKSTEEIVIHKEGVARTDIVDLSSLTKEQLQEMEV